MWSVLFAPFKWKGFPTDLRPVNDNSFVIHELSKTILSHPLVPTFIGTPCETINYRSVKNNN